MKTVRGSDKVANEFSVLVDEITAEKLRKHTYSDAIKYLLDCHLVFPSELISRVEELIEDKRLGYSCKEEFLYEAARQLLKYYSEDIESIKVRRQLYEEAKIAIEDLNLPFMSVDDFVEEQIKKLNEQHEQWKEQKKEAEKTE